MAGWTKMPLGKEVRLGAGHIEIDGDPAPPKGEQQPQFLAHVCCGEMAAWIKIPLDTKVGLGPGDIVLDADQAPPKRGTAAPHFSADVCCGQAAGWIKTPLGTEVGLNPGDIMLDGDPSPPTERGTTAHHFSAHVYCCQTVAHLSNCWALVCIRVINIERKFEHSLKYQLTVLVFLVANPCLLTDFAINEEIVLISLICGPSTQSNWLALIQEYQQNFWQPSENSCINCWNSPSRSSLTLHALSCAFIILLKLN